MGVIKELGDEGLGPKPSSSSVPQGHGLGVIADATHFFRPIRIKGCRHARAGLLGQERLIGIGFAGFFVLPHPSEVLNAQARMGVQHLAVSEEHPNAGSDQARLDVVVSRAHGMIKGHRQPMGSIGQRSHLIIPPDTLGCTGTLGRAGVKHAHAPAPGGQTSRHTGACKPRADDQARALRFGV